MILTKHWAKRMGIDLPEVDQTASFTRLTAFRPLFIPDLYAGKFMISREWGLPFPRLCFLFPSRPGLPSTVYYNYSIFGRERYHVKPVIDTPQATPLIPNLPPMIRANTRFAPTPASLRLDAIAPMTFLIRRIDGNRGNGIDRVNRPGVMMGNMGTVDRVHDMIHQPGVEPVGADNGVLPAAFEHRRMLFILNRGGPTPGADGNERTPLMTSAPFMVMRQDRFFRSNGVSIHAVNRDNVSNITWEHVRFAEIVNSRENSRESRRENVIENVRFYHVNNSRAGGGPGPGVLSPARGPEPGQSGNRIPNVPAISLPGGAQAVDPGHFNPTRAGEIEETGKTGKAEKIKIEQTDLDLEQFTHRVYGMLEQKIRLEKEMRGW